jgi:endonuclease/exonuclease/phosphatase family metal-dependent hydrolase
MAIRVLSWNCRRASPSHALWRHVDDLSPDIAVLQEVSGLPQAVFDTYDVRTATPPTKTDGRQRFQSAILARGVIGEPVPLRSSIEWVNDELERFTANLLSFRVTLPNQAALTVVCVYSPAWPVARNQLVGRELAGVKLTQNPDVWVSDLLVTALRERSNEGTEWIVAGDFNACETFDRWRGGPRGNREWLDRMAALGFTECLRHVRGSLTPTFRKPGAVTAHAQIDHMFVTRGVADALVSCETGHEDHIYGSQLSDHLPIVAEFSDIAADVAS